MPLLLPGINMDHVALLELQRERGWKGFIAPNPNCTAVGLAISLAPLHRRFGVRKVHMVSLQSVSGAGRSPGVIGLDILDNIMPFIPKEEEKVAVETQKILGTVDGETHPSGRLHGQLHLHPRGRCSRATPRRCTSSWRDRPTRRRSPTRGARSAPSSCRAATRARRQRSSTSTTIRSGPRSGWTAISAAA